MTRDELAALFDPIQHSNVECDGFSRIVFSVLTERGHKPILKAGALSARGAIVRPHLWIEVYGFMIDYQARRWLGHEPWIPHGVFRASETEAIYEGVTIEVKVLPEPIRRLMLMSFADVESESQSSLITPEIIR
ncbi:hypothetical protein P5706_34960 [Pseudomonas sp. ChxA]|uniref:hypothetical protein n=1 Tax=Pseudomonas TaxID=286 RepID=UPI0009977BA3|nr:MULTISPECIES: hypothetical protein [Pseudomonas]MBJ2204267.1 hypothetical protein [Pseudomonas carnis]MBX9407817.1 hypothetical protein [Pseudomonas baetica]MDL2189372.1 hypothetical protein [Pseudomonas sp. ChxA]NMX82546.1 hypothetical protein [Pseudomonas sp. WS 5503]NNB23884.1 hypothetical protein [Pseudomonas fragi]